MRGFSAVAACLLTVACGGQSAPSAPSPTTESLELRRQTLEEHYGRVLSDFGVGDIETVTVRIWQDEAAYFATLEAYFGQRYQASGYITGRDEIRVLAVPQLPVNVVHEFCHAASLYVNPSLANNPRWYWEAVALAYPTLQQLNAGPNASRQAYEVGYLLGEFIVGRWGRPAFLRLIQTNADVPATLGLSVQAFEEAWYEWVRQRYLQ